MALIVCDETGPNAKLAETSNPNSLSDNAQGIFWTQKDLLAAL